MDLQGQNQKIPKEGTGKLASHIHVDTINLWVNELSHLCQQIKLERTVYRVLFKILIQFLDERRGCGPLRPLLTLLISDT